jgi:short chain dehydrogenase
MDRPVSGRTGGGAVFVVGAGLGIGASVARRFAREGHPVGLVARDRARVEGIADDLRGGGHHAAAATGDITDPGDIARALGELTWTCSRRRCRHGGSTSAASPSSAPWGRGSPTNPTTSPNTCGAGTPRRRRR